MVEFCTEGAFEQSNVKSKTSRIHMVLTMVIALVAAPALLTILQPEQAAGSVLLAMCKAGLDG